MNALRVRQHFPTQFVALSAILPPETRCEPIEFFGSLDRCLKCVIERRKERQHVESAVIATGDADLGASILDLAIVAGGAGQACPTAPIPGGGRRGPGG